MNIVDKNLSSIGRGMAIGGVWIGWALALKALISPVLVMIESGSTATTVVGICILLPLYVFALILPYGATSAILDRWAKD